MGGSSEPQTTTTQTGFVNPQISQTSGNLSGRINKILDQPVNVFDKPIYAGLTDMGRNAIMQLGQTGTNNPGYSQNIGKALDYTGNIAAGGAFGENAPGYAALKQNAINDTITAGNSPFLSQGTFGSDKHAEALGRGISQTISGLDYQNYQNDIARQQAAQQALPGLLQASTLPQQLAISAGNMISQDALQGIQAEYDQFRRKNDAELNRLAQLSAIQSGNVSGAPTYTTQTQQVPVQSPLQTIAGLGLLGAGMFL